MTNVTRIDAAAAALEAVVMNGDLSKLNATERLEYYRAVCASVALNPLTRPFDFLSLNGKVILYARKEASDQLANLRKLNRRIVERQMFDGEIYVVTARATTIDGREEESTGAVSLKGLAGEALANAYMKCETKAKRRVTLSICGLGLLDESEIDSIPGAARWQEPPQARISDLYPEEPRAIAAPAPPPTKPAPPDDEAPPPPDDGGRGAFYAACTRRGLQDTQSATNQERKVETRKRINTALGLPPVEGVLPAAAAAVGWDFLRTHIEDAAELPESVTAPYWAEALPNDSAPDQPDTDLQEGLDLGDAWQQQTALARTDPADVRPKAGARR